MNIKNDMTTYGRGTDLRPQHLYNVFVVSCGDAAENDAAEVLRSMYVLKKVSSGTVCVRTPLWSSAKYPQIC